MRNLRLEINRFRLEDVLQEISYLSREIINTPKDSEGLITNAMRLSYSVPYHIRHYKKPSFILTSWSLIDLAYYVLINLSDSFTKYPFDKNMFYNQIHYFINKEVNLGMPKQGDGIFLYLYGFLGEQLKFQTGYKVIDNFCREQYLVRRIYSEEEIDKFILSEVGVDSHKLHLSILYLYATSLNDFNFESFKSILADVSTQDVRAVMEYYTIDYNSVKSSPLKRQQLYITPFIRMESGRIIPVNTYLIYSLFESSTFWIIRNHFNKQGKRNFINEFTKGFEDYVDGLFTEYVGADSYEKIPTSTKNGEKRADFKVQLDRFNFLFEVKGALAPLEVKQQDTDVKSIRKFLERTLNVAVQQLQKTEEHFSPTKFYKVVLLYEGYFKSEIMETVLSNLEVFDDGTYWIMTIEELEKLLYLYQNDIEIFRRIMEEKINIEESHSPNGRDFEQIFARNEIFENTHLKSSRFSEFYSKIIERSKVVDESINKRV
jgi:hypothetical protein